MVASRSLAHNPSGAQRNEQASLRAAFENGVCEPPPAASGQAHSLQNFARSEFSAEQFGQRMVNHCAQRAIASSRRGRETGGDRCERKEALRQRHLHAGTVDPHPRVGAYPDRRRTRRRSFPRAHYLSACSSSTTRITTQRARGIPAVLSNSPAVKIPAPTRERDEGPLGWSLALVRERRSRPLCAQGAGESASRGQK